MVLQVLSDTGAVGDQLDTVFGQMRCRADARQHQNFRRVDRGSGDDHLAPGLDHFDAAATLDLNPGGAAIPDYHPTGETTDDVAIRVTDRWREKQNVFLLAVCQMLFFSGRMLIVATAPVIGYTYAADKAFVTPRRAEARPA